ncbi:MAG TPA: DUF4157 domain-containing protein, partial [Fibrobacteria bacterium]|nr:DUF4157 domain-containing protein [Fibrobacteria bacterium]
CPRCSAGLPVRAKLKSGGGYDPFEAEADAAAERALSGNGPDIRAGGSPVTEVLPDPGRAGFPGAGRPLPPGLRARFEAGFGRDLSRVRIHTDSHASAAAASLGARAFAVGGHIAFGAGEFDPGSGQGRRLIAHEVAHTLQPGPAVPRRQPVNPAEENKPPANLGPPVSEVPTPPMGGVTYKNGQWYWWGKNLPLPILKNTGDIPLNPAKIPDILKGNKDDKRKKADCTAYATHPHPAGSDAFLGQCCSSTIESAENCCPPDRIAAGDGCCPPGKTVQGNQCVTPSLPPGWTFKLPWEDHDPFPGPGKPAAQPEPPKPIVLDFPGGTLDDFDVDADAINPRQEAKLQELKAKVVNHVSLFPNTWIELVGSADKPGTPEHNLDLGQRRAERVRFILQLALMGKRPGLGGFMLARSEGAGEATGGEEGKAGYNPAERKVEVILHSQLGRVTLTPPEFP